MISLVVRAGAMSTGGHRPNAAMTFAKWLTFDITGQRGQLSISLWRLSDHKVDARH